MPLIGCIFDWNKLYQHGYKSNFAGQILPKKSENSKMKVFALITVAFAQVNNRIFRLQAQVEHFQNVTTDDGIARMSRMIRVMDFQ